METEVMTTAPSTPNVRLQISEGTVTIDSVPSGTLRAVHRLGKTLTPERFNSDQRGSLDADSPGSTPSSRQTDHRLPSEHGESEGPTNPRRAPRTVTSSHPKYSVAATQGSDTAHTAHGVIARPGSWPNRSWPIQRGLDDQPCKKARIAKTAGAINSQLHCPDDTWMGDEDLPTEPSRRQGEITTLNSVKSTKESKPTLSTETLSESCKQQLLQGKFKKGARTRATSATRTVPENSDKPFEVTAVCVGPATVSTQLPVQPSRAVPPQAPPQPLPHLPHSGSQTEQPPSSASRAKQRKPVHCSTYKKISDLPLLDEITGIPNGCRIPKWPKIRYFRGIKCTLKTKPELELRIYHLTVNEQLIVHHKDTDTFYGAEHEKFDLWCPFKCGKNGTSTRVSHFELGKHLNPSARGVPHCIPHESLCTTTNDRSEEWEAGAISGETKWRPPKRSSGIPVQACLIAYPEKCILDNNTGYIDAILYAKDHPLDQNVSGLGIVAEDIDHRGLYKLTNVPTHWSHEAKQMWM